MHKEQRDYHWSSVMLSLTGMLLLPQRTLALNKGVTSVSGIMYSFLIVASSLLFYDLTLCVVLHAVLDDDELTVLKELF